MCVVYKDSPIQTLRSNSIEGPSKEVVSWKLVIAIESVTELTQQQPLSRSFRRCGRTWTFVMLILVLCCGVDDGS